MGMGKKRSHAGGGSSGHGGEDAARKRARLSRPYIPKPQLQNADSDSLGAIKKRARTIERLLARDNLNLPANKKNDLERELAANKQRIEDARNKKERSKMIQKYHMVRFFERKKAMRFAKQVEKKLAQATDPEEIAQLKTDLHVAQVDIDYARYFPFMEPYISLYAGPSSAEKDAENTAAQYLRTPRPPMWSVIEKTREQGGSAALDRLQNRRPQASSTEAQQPAPEDEAPAKLRQAKKTKEAPRRGPRASKSEPSRARGEVSGANQAEESDGDSDGGGFFE